MSSRHWWRPTLIPEVRCDTTSRRCSLLGYTELVLWWCCLVDGFLVNGEPTTASKVQAGTGRRFVFSVSSLTSDVEVQLTALSGRLSMLVSFVTPDQGCVQADVGPTCTGYQYSSSDAGTSPQ